MIPLFFLFFFTKNGLVMMGGHGQTIMCLTATSKSLAKKT